MKIIIAPQALKGSLEAPDVARAIAHGLQRVWPQAEYILLPVADGGEGTVRALVAATGGRIIPANVTGPLGKKVEGFFGILGTPTEGAGARATPVKNGGTASGSESAGTRFPQAPAPEGEPPTAVIEMAAAAGLPLVPETQRDPRFATTRGVGELIRLALDHGCRRLIIGIGGSATNDGGAGMALALGAALLDEQGAELPAGGAALARLSRISIAHLDQRLRNIETLVACDVTNPLCGPEGASAVYGPQKGATPAMVIELDAALAHYAEVIRRDLHKDVRDVPGAGAAGGLGAGLLAFLNATLTPGAPLILDALRLNDHLRGAVEREVRAAGESAGTQFPQAPAAEGAALVFTAEGRLDQQTAYGKAVAAVAARAQARGVPVIALAGSLGPGYDALYQHGIDALLPIPDAPMPLQQAQAQAAELLASAAERAARLITIGRQLPPSE
ncbi:MAG TPA: glycerate kinase [Ktedonobacterales bacterium]